MAIKRGRWFVPGTFTLVALLTTSLQAQSTPPVKGTLALEATMERVYRAANVIIVVTRDGVQHAYRFTKDLVVHGAPQPDPFVGLRQGTTVVLHYQVGEVATVTEIDRVGIDDGLVVTEGMVTKIDRKRRVITVRFDSGRVEQLALTERAAAELPPDDPAALARVRVYYTDDMGRKVVHYFTTVETPLPR